ncbi:MAG: thioesterase family protein, partial [Actinomycetota bacterium]
MPFEFDEATSLSSLGGGAYATPIHDRWDINGNANGGYLLALVANAMRAESGRAHPVSVTMHYLSPGPAGDGVTTTKVMKSGKRFVTVAGTIAQGGRDIATALGVFGDIDSSVPPHSVTMDRVDIPPFEECPPRAAPPVPDGAPPMGLSSRLDMRIHP